MKSNGVKATKGIARTKKKIEKLPAVRTVKTDEQNF